MSSDITDINEFRQRKQRQRLVDNGHVSIGFIDDKINPCQGFSGISRGMVLDDGTMTEFVCPKCGESVCNGALHSDTVR